MAPLPSLDTIPRPVRASAQSRQAVGVADPPHPQTRARAHTHTHTHTHTRAFPPALLFYSQPPPTHAPARRSQILRHIGSNMMAEVRRTRTRAARPPHQGGHCKARRAVSAVMEQGRGERFADPSPPGSPALNSDMRQGA